MTLRLLSPKEAGDKSRKSVEAEKHRLVEIEALVAQKLRELAAVEKDFNDALEHNRVQWEMETERIRKGKVLLLNEVEELERRKAAALLPLTEREKELDTIASALDSREAELTTREAVLDENAGLLQRRLDEVSEREIQADKVAYTLFIREDGVKSQQANITAQSTALTEAIRIASNESQERERSLNLREISLNGREHTLNQREREVGEKDASFVKREMVIQDRTAMLERAFAELKEKQYGTNTTS